MVVLQGREAAVAVRLTKAIISVVIPTLNEEANIASFLCSLQKYRGRAVELVLVDGGSVDATVSLAEPLVDQLILAEPGRARQMNAGAEKACGEVLCFLHADTILPDTFLEHLDAFRISASVWGRFDVRLSGSRYIFKVIGFMISWRSRVTGIASGDQAIFVKRNTFDGIGGFPDIPLMEDIGLSQLLVKKDKPYCIRSPVVTSSRRWEKHGVWKTILLMWKLRLLYYLGIHPAKLHRQYYGSSRLKSDG